LAQITALNFVATMSDLGIPLKTIAELRKKRDPEKLSRVLEKKSRELDMELRKLRERSSIIHTKQEMIRFGLRVDENQISVMFKEEDRQAVLWPRNEYKQGDTFIEPLTAFVNQAEKLRINLSFPIGGRYENMETFTEAPDRPDYFFSIDTTGTNVRKRGEYLVGFARGYYGELGDLPKRMAEYAKENDLNIPGHVYITYPHDEACFPEPDHYLAQVMVAVSRPKHRARA